MRILFIILLVSTTISAAEVYKTVDKDGNISYSDKPGPNSVKMEIKEPIGVPPVSFKPRPTKRPESGIPTAYTITIDYPTPELHINPGTRDLPLQVSTDPPVHPSHILVVYDNDEPVDDMLIEYIINGTHVIQAEVIDEKGRLLGQSESVNVYVHRPTINSRRNIDNRRPSYNRGY